MRFYSVQVTIRGQFYEWIVLALSKNDAMRAVEAEGLPGVPNTMEAFECDLQAAVITRPTVNEESNANG